MTTAIDYPVEIFRARTEETIVWQFRGGDAQLAYGTQTYKQTIQILVPCEQVVVAPFVQLNWSVTAPASDDLASSAFVATALPEPGVAGSYFVSPGVTNAFPRQGTFTHQVGCEQTTGVFDDQASIGNYAASFAAPPDQTAEAGWTRLTGSWTGTRDRPDIGVHEESRWEWSLTKLPDRDHDGVPDDDDDCPDVFNPCPGRIVVAKQTLPGENSQSFAFTTSYGPGFSLSDGQSNTSGPLAAGSYSVSETAVSGWDASASCSDGSPPSNITLSNGETVTCTFTNTQRGSVTLKKTTNGVVDPSKDILFVLTGPGVPSAGISRSTFGDQDGVLDFGSGNLLPAQTYKICETPVPAGFTSFWKLDGAIVTPYNPDASRTPPEDLGTRCYAFSVSPGQARAFEVDNSHPGGDPRTIGYWKNWNRCTGGNQSATAAKNGGAAEGFFLVEDLLPQLVGDFSVTSCQQAVKLLSKQDQDGKSKSSDAAYELGAQLLAARFNLAAGAETCLAVQQAVLDGQTLLDGLGFTGSGDYLGSKSKDPRRAQALALATTLDRYNNGNLC